MNAEILLKTRACIPNTMRYRIVSSDKLEKQVSVVRLFSINSDKLNLWLTS